MKTNEQKIKDLGTKLNMAATNKEYQILKDRIAADKMANSVLEDEILERMGQINAFGPKIAESEKLLKTTQEKLAAAHTKVEQQAYTIQADIDRLEVELSKWKANCRKRFARTICVARDQGEDALAEVVNGACGGCFQQVPVNVQSKSRMSQPSFCRSCGRLLYFSEEK